MRFKHKPAPRRGDIRYKVFFAWWPIRIELETRWLEKVSVRQIYKRGLLFDIEIGYWGNQSFEQQPLPDFKFNASMPENKKSPS